VALQAETFGAPHLRDSLARVFVASSEGEQQLGYRAQLELRTTKECASVDVLGGGSSSAEDESVTLTEVGPARTFSWSVGALSSHYTAAATLTRGSHLLPGNQPHVLQLTAKYKHASGGMRMRVSTLQVPRLPSKVPTRQLLPAFDQQAAAALVIRQSAKQAASGASPSELLTSLDRMLIKVMRALCEYAKGNPASVLLPPQAAQLPGLVFHLRRSPAVRTSGLSPDETAYFRHLIATLSVFSSLVLVQPTLMGYAGGGGVATPLPLEASSMHPERTLLLDTFLKLIVCHGATVAAWRRSPQSGDHPEIGAQVEAALTDQARLAAERFPAPETFECDQYGSKARYLVQKLNPDVPLSTFLQGLYKAIVS